MLKAAKRHSTAVRLLGLIVSLALQGCNHVCQAPATTPFQHLSDVTWRAVSTTNPNVTITLFDFIEMSFKNDFTGQVVKVVNNLEYSQQPIEVFTWAVPVGTQGTGQLQIQYSTPPTQNADGTQADSTGGTTTQQYSFSLTNELDLTEAQTGYAWRFVPMEGIVPPDTNCTF